MRHKSPNSVRGLIADALKAATFEDADFSEIWHLELEFPLPKSEDEVNAFIKGRTDLYMRTWVLPRLREALEKITPKKPT